jgi:hypothetical protein
MQVRLDIRDASLNAEFGQWVILEVVLLLMDFVEGVEVGVA